MIIAQGNHLLITIKPLDNNHLTDLIVEEDHQIKEIHKFSHKIDTVDKTVKTISIETTIQDQIQIGAIIRTSLKTVHIQTLVIDSVQTIDPETPHTIGTETIHIVETDSIKIKHHETNQKIDQTIIDQTILTITIDHVIIHTREI